MAQENSYPQFKRFICLIAIASLSLWVSPSYAQDTTKTLLDLNNSKILKKANKFLDTTQKKINNFINKKIEKVRDSLNKKTNRLLDKTGLNEIDKQLPYERLLNKKYTLGRRAYQNTVSQFNYLFHAEIGLDEIIQKAREQHEDDYTELLPFYDYDLSITAKESIDSIIYRCNANIVLHDLRSNYVDDAYLVLAKAYLFHKNFDTAASILQFINYSFFEKEDGADLPIGSNLNKPGKFSIASPENNRVWENKNVRNESMIWQARTYFEAGEINEGISLLQLLKTDLGFPKRLQPFLYEQLAYGYYLSGMNDSAANYLVKGLDNAIDPLTKARWSFLIAQLYEKEQKIDLAYNWFKKAGAIVSNPVIAVYASIYMASIDANRGEKSWESLASALERMIKKEKYAAFADIIYYEMAQLALRNQSITKANQWLIASIQKNEKNTKLKQKTLVQLGAINYKIDQFSVAKIAYENLNDLLKTFPNYDEITLRKKWMGKIAELNELIANEDSLQMIYAAPKIAQESMAKKWQKRITLIKSQEKDLFTDPNKKNLASDSNNKSNQNNNPGYSFANAFGNSTSKQDAKSDFYFDNPQNVSMGITNFIKKWGDRPNVDNWRRKTTIQLARASKANIDSTQASMQLNTGQVVNNNTKSISQEKDSAVQLNIQLIQTDTDLKQSKINWNNNSLSIAKIFLYELNDFEKALPRYQAVIQSNIEPITTESALLDLASHYLHIGQVTTSDSLIALITKQFPEGIYVQKKKAKENLERIDKNSAEAYKAAYFLAQIGDWDQFGTQMEEAQKQFKGTKWNTPYQFLKVKMYAQLGKDSLAIEYCNEIIAQNKSESTKARAKNIITEINNRKATEAYLAALIIVKPSKLINTNEEAIVRSKANAINSKNDSNLNGAPNLKMAVNPKNDSTFSKNVTNQITFTNDSLEQHYIALQTMNVSTIFVKEIQNAIKDYNTETFKQLNLAVTYVQFTDQSHIVWIGPFEKASDGLTYINKVKPRLSTEIISFIAKKQYDLTLIGKSNIVLINNQEQLEQYKRDKSNYYFKP
ncbi:MAG: tetratricopeptide repeat protein [Chitinophagia bacterium]